MDRQVSLDIQDFCNSYYKNKAEKEAGYWLLLENQYNLTKKDGKIVWDGDNIKGFQPYQAMETISVTVVVGESGVEVK